MLLTLTLEGVTRDFHVDSGDVVLTDWTEIVVDMLDTVIKAKEDKF